MSSTLIIILAVVALYFYLAPTFVVLAWGRGSCWWLFGWNVLVGWTGLGYVFCWVWAIKRVLERVAEDGIPVRVIPPTVTPDAP
jgi:hypothetical protein